MNSFSEALNQFSEALPETLSFYHLGNVRMETATKPFDLRAALRDAAVVSFGLHGDLRGVFALLFEKGLDPSVYMEMGNVIASQMVTKLNIEKSLDIVLSPPRILDQAEMRRARFTELPFAHRSYVHVTEGNTIPVETLILPIPTEGNADA